MVKNLSVVSSLLPLLDYSVAQQELSVVSGTFPELQGSCQSCDSKRTVEKASCQVSSAQDIE